MDYKNVNDYELMYRIREKDDDAFDLLFKKYEPIIISMAKKYFPFVRKLGVEMSDLVQEGRIAIVRAINSFDMNSSSIFYTYVCICIERQFVSYLRNQSTNKNKPLNYSVGDDSLYSFADMRYEPVSYLCDRYDEEELANIKNSLKFLDSNIFELRYNGFSYREISDLLDISIGAVDSRLFRIRKNLQRK